MLWGERVMGWGNWSAVSGQLNASFGYASSRPPKDPAFRRELDAELARMEAILRVATRGMGEYARRIN
jgi:hypothetical protein